MNLHGYIGIRDADGNVTEVINACRTIAYMRNGQRTHEEGYTYPSPRWAPPTKPCADGCAGTCSSCFDDEDYTWPGDTGGNPAPWYDPNIAASAEFFGVVLDEFTLSAGYGRASLQSARGNRSHRQKRQGIARGHIVASSCAGTSYGLEYLQAMFSPGIDARGGCSGQNCDMSIDVYRPDCECDSDAADRAAGWRTLHGVTGFVVTELLENPDGDCVPCSVGAYIEITFEVANTRAYFPAESVASIDTDAIAIPDCEANEFDDSCETEELEVVRNRNTRQVKVMRDGTLCPIGWDFDFDWNEDTDRLVIASIEEAAENGAAGFLLELREDYDTGEITAWDVVTGLAFDPEDWDCGVPARVVKLEYINPNYDPLCSDCPAFAEDCADANSIELDAQGFIDWVATGIDEDVWYQYDPDNVNGGTDAELTQLANYWDCIALQPTGPSNSRLDAPNVGNLDLLLQSAKSSFNTEFVIPHGVPASDGPTLLKVRVGVNSGGIGPTFINAQSTAQATGPGWDAINVTYRVIIDEWPGWNRSVFDDDEYCGDATAIPDHCKPVLEHVLDTSKPLATTVVFTDEGGPT